MRRFRTVLVAILALVAPTVAFATSGACSYHGGVNCAAGAGAYGQVICNDGWLGSSVSYASMEECQTTPPSNTGSAFAFKQQCASYTSAIQNEISNANAYAEANSQVHPDAGMTDVLGEVFYSPVENSCLYTETVELWIPSVTIDAKTIPAGHNITYSIRDYLDNESDIYSVVVEEPMAPNDPKLTQFDSMVAYYKGNSTAPESESSVTPTQEVLPAFTASAPQADDSGVVPPKRSESAASSPKPAPAAPVKPAENSGGFFDSMTGASSSTATSSSVVAATAQATVTPKVSPPPQSFFGGIYNFFIHLFGF